MLHPTKFKRYLFKTRKNFWRFSFFFLIAVKKYIFPSRNTCCAAKLFPTNYTTFTFSRYFYMNSNSNEKDPRYSQEEGFKFLCLLKNFSSSGDTRLISGVFRKKNMCILFIRKVFDRNYIAVTLVTVFMISASNIIPDFLIDFYKIT